MHSTNLISLPHDILVHTFSRHLTIKDLCRTSQSCKKLDSLTKHPLFWKNLFEKEHPEYFEEATKQNLQNQNDGIYKRLYGQLIVIGKFLTKSPKFNEKNLNYLFEAERRGFDLSINLIISSIKNPTALKECCFVSAAWGNEKTVKAFLDQGFPVNSRDERQMTLLHNNAMNGTRSVVPLLIRYGANPNLIDKYGWTPLHWAARNGQTQIAKELIELGADSKIHDLEGKTPLTLAKTSPISKPQTIAFLENLKNPFSPPQSLVSRIIDFIKNFFDKIRKQIDFIWDKVQKFSQKIRV